MKISPFLAALAISLASALLPASAQPNGSVALSKPTTYTATRNLYRECLGMFLADSLMHGFMNKGGFFAELNGILSACKMDSHF